MLWTNWGISGEVNARDTKSQNAARGAIEPSRSAVSEFPARWALGNEEEGVDEGRWMSRRGLGMRRGKDG